MLKFIKDEVKKDLELLGLLLKNYVFILGFAKAHGLDTLAHDAKRQNEIVRELQRSLYNIEVHCLATAEDRDYYKSQLEELTAPGE